MEDREIIALYHRRCEEAIGETDRKYGGLCRRIAWNLLGVREDAEECVNDTWLAAWRLMPPEAPRALGTFLGRITRNLSISRFRANRAVKRDGGLEVLLSELEQCLPDPAMVEREVERRELTGLVAEWLSAQPEEDRRLFLRRYWYGEQVKTLAAEEGDTQNRMAQRMLRLRRGLRHFLEEKGVAP